MDTITEKIYLWVANDEGLYEMATTAGGWTSLQADFQEYLSQGGTFLARDILEDLLNLVDWYKIYTLINEEN